MSNSAHTLSLLMILLFLLLSKSQAGDERCRCVCPPLSTIDEVNTTSFMVNGTDLSNRVVWTEKDVKADSCNCSSVLSSRLPNQISQYVTDIDKMCLRCKCHFEERNSQVQKVVIIFVIVILSLMFIYGLFLMCLDPLINKQKITNTVLTDDIPEDQDDESQALILPGLPQASGSGSRSRAVSTAVNRVRQQQQRWKGQVTEQRKNIYSRHKMLA